MVHNGATHCYSHSPDAAERRKAAAHKGVKARQNDELTQVKQELRDIAAKVRSGELTTARGSVTAQVLGVFLKAVEQERKQKEMEAIESRLAALESDAGLGQKRSA